MKKRFPTVSGRIPEAVNKKIEKSVWGRAGYTRDDDNHRTRCFRFADELRSRITHGVRPGQDVKKNRISDYHTGRWTRKCLPGDNQKLFNFFLVKSSRSLKKRRK